MIVLVILVLLVAMVGPRLLGSQKKADINAPRRRSANLEAALELYTVDMRTVSLLGRRTAGADRAAVRRACGRQMGWALSG